MEIFFCSHCNQSIPLKDIQDGAAELRRGKYLCVTCKEIVRSPQERRSNPTAMVLGLFLVGALAVIAYLIFQEDLFPAPGRVAGATANRQSAILDQLAELKGELGRLESLSGRRVEQAVDALRARIERQEQTLARSLERIDALSARSAVIADDDDVRMLKQELEGIRRGMETVRGVVGELEAGLLAAARDATKAANPAPPPVAAPTPKPEVSEVDRWIEQLRDKEAGPRFTAVTELTRFKGPKVDRALIAALADSDYFIRRFVAEELGERKKAEAAPGLVRLLEDDDESVREAAVRALRKITGKNFGFKSRAPARERARLAARWRKFVETERRK